MTIAKRLAALESKLVRPPEAEAVDMKPVMARLAVAIIAGHYGKRRKNESDLSAFARAMHVSPARLFAYALRDRKRFAKRLGSLDKRADADAVADYVVREFIIEETTYRLIEACVDEAGPWLSNMLGAPPWPGLCKVRPLRLPGSICKT